MTDRAERAVGNAFGDRFFGLIVVNGPLGLLIKHADIEQGRILFAAENVFENASFIRDLRISKQFFYAIRDSVL